MTEQDVVASYIVMDNIGQKVQTAVEEESASILKINRDRIDQMLSRMLSLQFSVESQMPASRNHPEAILMEEAIHVLVPKIYSFQERITELKTHVKYLLGATM